MQSTVPVNNLFKPFKGAEKTVGGLVVVVVVLR